MTEHCFFVFLIVGDAGVQGNSGGAFPAGNRKAVPGIPGPEDESLEAVLGLGELAGLTVNNEADPLNYDVSK